MAEVAAIVSLYNSHKFIAGFLDRASRQTHQDLEFVFVVNYDKYGDPNYEIGNFISENFKRPKRIIQVQREGIYASWNRAIKASDSKFIVNMNVDDCHAANSIQHLMHPWGRTNHFPIDTIFAAYGDWRIVPVEFQQNAANTANSLTGGKMGNTAPRFTRNLGPHVLWPRSIHESMGYFDESFKAAGDHEMWLRIMYRVSISGTPAPPFMKVGFHPNVNDSCAGEDQWDVLTYYINHEATLSNQHGDGNILNGSSEDARLLEMYGDLFYR